MEFGISFLPDHTPETMSAAEYFDNALRLSAQADRGQLKYIKMTEHYIGAYGGYCPSPLIFLAAVAQRTAQIRLLPGGILPIFSHPIKIAAEAAMLDAISDGRLEVGFARAYLPYEFDAYGVDLDESRDRYRETISAVLQLWTRSKVNAECPYFSYENISSLPRPTQLPHPPVWATAVRSRESFAWIGEQGFGLLVTTSFSPLSELRDKTDVYKEAYSETLHPGFQKPRVAISIPLFIDEDDGVATRDGDYYLRRYLRTWSEAAGSWDHRASSDYLGYTGLAQRLNEVSVVDLRRSYNAVVGTPDRVVDSIKRIEEVLEPDFILWQIDFGAMPFHKSTRTLELFIDRVLPTLNA